MNSTRLQELKSAPRSEGEASFFFFDAMFGVDAVKVMPGQYFVAREDIAIQTVLGSCVAACIYDRTAGVGGLNHFLLPSGDGSSARYGVNAMEVLINSVLRQGARRERLEAKIFGGGAVIQGLGSINVGGQNVAFIDQFMRDERIPVVSRDVLDTVSRKVVMFPKSAKVMVKKLPATSALNTETTYLAKAKSSASMAGEVELF
jgi:chemotaxis protein CheD